MTLQEIQNNINNIVNTLGTITVSGKENMNRLLGCIMLLETMPQHIAALVQPPEEAHDDAESEDE